MSKNKNKNNGASTEEKKPVSVITNTFIDGRDIRNILCVGKPKSPVCNIYEMAALDKLYFIKENDYGVLMHFLETNTKIPSLVISGEPDIRVVFKGVTGKFNEPKEIFRYFHPNIDRYIPHIFGSQQPQQKRNTAHYLFGNKNPKYPGELWNFRKEFEDLSVKFSEYSVSDMSLMQGYIKTEGIEKKGKVKDIVTSVVNLGKNTEFEAHIGDEIYLSKGFEDTWYNIRDCATILSTGGKI